MPVTVLMGTEKHVFHLDEDQLCKYSSFFDSALRGGFKESKGSLSNLQRQTSRHFRFSRSAPGGDNITLVQSSLVPKEGDWAAEWDENEDEGDEKPELDEEIR
jgi:hypothetical protein